MGIPGLRYLSASVVYCHGWFRTDDPSSRCDLPGAEEAYLLERC